ncbi:MAG: hypothetical protein AABW41_01770 [Nanoarchaeota archaeon]
MTTREEIFNEMERLRKECAEKSKKFLEHIGLEFDEEKFNGGEFWQHYLNNLSLKTSCKFRDDVEKLAIKDNTCDIKGFYLNSDSSELRKSQSLRQFHMTIDKVIAEEKIDLEELRTISDIAEINKRLFGAYIRLRELGYNHWPDLTA